MKKITLTILTLLALMLAGCAGNDNQNNSQKTGSDQKTGNRHKGYAMKALRAEKVVFYDHSYIYFYDIHVGHTPVRVIHDPDCSCYKSKE